LREACKWGFNEKQSKQLIALKVLKSKPKVQFRRIFNQECSKLNLRHKTNA